MGDHTQFYKKMDLYLYVFVLALTWDFLRAGESKSAIFMPLAQPPREILSCPENEYFKYCLGDCSDCDRRGNCPQNCSRTGCDCLLNYVRLEKGGKCEPVSKCPRPKCGENEVFRSCGPMCEKCSLDRCRILSCQYKCYCKEGYMRDIEGNCIPEEECPPKFICLSRTEERRADGPADEYCLHAANETVANGTADRENCFCKPGFKRNAMGYCVRADYCGYVVCLRGEVYQTCPKKCNTTCRNYGDPDCKEDGNCYPGCFCPEGLYMNDHRVCVPLEQCPPGSNPFLPTISPSDLTSVTQRSDTSSTTNAPWSSSTVPDVSSTYVEDTTEWDSLGDEDVPTEVYIAGNVDEETYGMDEETTIKVTPTTPKPKSAKTAQGGKTAKAKASAQRTTREKETPPSRKELTSPPLPDEKE